jgi:hypothetical protein
MKAKVTIDGKEYEITLTEEQIRQFRENWTDEYLKSLPIATESVVLYTRNQNMQRFEFEALFPQSTEIENKAEIANKVCHKIYLLARMTQFALLRNGEWVADWDDCRQRKYGILAHNHFVFGIAVKSMEIAKEMLSIFEEDIIKYYK